MVNKVDPNKMNPITRLAALVVFASLILTMLIVFGITFLDTNVIIAGSH